MHVGLDSRKGMGMNDLSADLEACAREPIHIPGGIQPHGVLFWVQEPTLTVLQVSETCAEFLGRTPADLLGTDVRTLLSPADAERLEAALVAADPAAESPLLLTVNSRAFEALLHRQEGGLLIELELAPPQSENFARHHRRLQASLTAMQNAATDEALYAAMAKAVAELTGYERVMVYRFDEDWHGEVVGETLLADVDSYFGLHFPATDIPEQARALYSRTWLRIIPTSSYEPSPLVPPLNPLTGRPLDLSYVGLRSVSPVHLEYLRNMNVGASMSISLLVGGKLWGLIACHHRVPRPLPFAVRSACELLGQGASAEIAERARARRLAELVETGKIQTRFFEVIAQEENFADALLRYAPTLLEFMGANGAAITQGEQRLMVGQTPPREAMPALLEWLETQADSSRIVATDRLSELWPPAAAWKELTSGLLAVKLSRLAADWVIWFRQEVLATVTWAGNPEKPAEPGLRLHPRKSFAAWQETVTGRSAPWTEAERQGAQELRLARNALVLRRTERLLQLNGELERKNSDLNSFAHIASHDLREPLRGIFHFARFLREDHAADLGEDGLARVDTIARLAAHTNELLASLSRFSQLGRMELTLKPTPLDVLIEDVLASLAVTIQETGAIVRQLRPLPVVNCDGVLVREVFANLVANAIRYNDKPERIVEVDWREPREADGERGPVIMVRDNGIGIRERNFDAVFQIFRRLNKEKFPDGAGAGLAIVKSIVERHGGRIWLESVFGEGTTFHLTLE